MNMLEPLSVNVTLFFFFFFG